MSENLDLNSLKKLMNWSDEDMLLVGYCVLSFERVTFLIAGLLEDDGGKRMALLDKTAGQIAEVVKQKFGEKSFGYTNFKNLVNDRNAIIHAYGFPSPNEDKWNRLRLKNGAIENDINQKFMVQFIKRCFYFFPIQELNDAIEKLRQESKQ